jgi:hypothetical protein
MFYALAGLMKSPEGNPVIVPFAHNLSGDEVNTFMRTQADLLTSNNIKVSKFTHAFRHEDDVYPEECPGCNAALTEYLSILEERRAADEQRKAPAIAPTPTNP